MQEPESTRIRTLYRTNSSEASRAARAKAVDFDTQVNTSKPVAYAFYVNTFYSLWFSSSYGSESVIQSVAIFQGQP